MIRGWKVECSFDHFLLSAFHFRTLDPLNPYDLINFFGNNNLSTNIGIGSQKFNAEV